MSVRRAARAVAQIRHPRLRLTLGELGSVSVRRRRVMIGLVPGDEPFRADIEKAALRAAQGVGIGFSAVDPGVRRTRVAELRRSAPDPGTAGSPTQVIFVGSGKGGVGKSSVAANLAVTMVRLGYTVGLLDADVWGYSIPAMLGVARRPISGRRIVPPMAHGVRVLSTEPLLPDDEEVVVWRGPMLHRTLEQFASDVDWGGPDFLFVDLPPGTGDVALTMAEVLPGGELLLVTTPEEIASAVAMRAARFAERLGIPVAGVVENFSWFRGDDGTEYTPFGCGGGRQVAEDLGVELLARLPLIPVFREGADRGSPVVPGSELAVLFEALALTLVARIPRKRSSTELRIG